MVDFLGVNNSRDPITILITVAVRLYRDGLAAALSAQQHLRVLGTAATSLEASATARNALPDVVIVDVSLEDALNLMRSLRSDCAKTRILAFAVEDDITAILNYAEAGADGFVTANGSVADLVEAIERTAAGELLCSPKVAAQLLRRAVHQAKASMDDVAGDNLTGREGQVFSLLKQGQSNKEIAGALNIAEATVKNHVHHVLTKLQVSTRLQAIASGALPVKATLLRRRLSSREAS
jgi:two-component system, NarL family, nitrate/nitrite response regulator NarL